ncbi:MAG TPA: ABC transporter ATP-binding protein [Candidatus Limnocylindrales bacterium]|nr:ABC transporter ATP-binding protein [Candidatus Limnocylindrales bacterium]
MRALGKRYHVGTSGGALYDRLGGALGRRSAAETDAQTMWAIRDVSFEVPQGHVLAVLGRNGSGKSTLMKILAKVTAPTEGEAMTRGRVGAMLQVGTGFHPELTGRDNILLSGMILGMGRHEIESVQDQIIEFAEIGRYLDAPVKHYSSGMYLRLAFSVSAHLAADILLIDEVLAVGDAGFQRKCQARIRELVGMGKTVLFVSHSAAAVRSLCDSAVVLDQGTIRFTGDTEDALRFYETEIVSS